ncbi:MAG TPA: peptide chain release factor N(5)-glutamine methyltransferase [Pirellulales bacterium]|jgi:release factor glutamine methyltransferase|nr:peptide chain release factor N(5)-glutamine methyltransferase [Pirellulales bacterium]
MSESWTIGRLLTFTADYLKQHGSDTPRLDAEVLLAAARGCQRIQLYTAFDEVADDKTRQTFRGWVRRRAEGTPVAYLVGYREFYSLRFRVTPAVLIPRPETELLVVRLLDLAKERPAGSPEIRIADVGTGSGILAVCAAKHLSTARVTAIDISPDAIDVAKSNAAEHGVSDRIEWRSGDLLSTVSDQQFDFIVSNPPYVSSAEYASLAKTVRDFEPRGALLAGDRGTEVIERLLPQAAEHLAPGGWLLIEISPMIEPAAARLLAAEQRLVPAPTIKDLAGHARIVQARRRE